MKAIINNTWLVFKKTPGFFSTMTVWPIIMLLLMTVILAYSTTHKIAVIDNSTDGTGSIIRESIASVEGLELIKVTENEVTQKILAGNIELAVILTDNGKANLVKLSTGSEVEEVLKTMINTALLVDHNSMTVQVNEVKEKGLTMSYSLGVMLFKFITAGSTLAGLLIVDRNNRMKGRIFLSGIKGSSYLGGRCIVHFGAMLITAVVYYVFCLIFNFNFGMEHSIYFLLMVIVTIVFSIGVFAFLSTVLKEDGSLWSIATFIFFPMSLFSGALFPFENMPLWMQNVGAFFPQRWITLSIEIIQKQNSIIPALPYIGGVFGLATIFFIIASIRTNTIKAMA